MAQEEVVQPNFSSGELSPKMAGRAELAVVKSGCRRLRNFISELEGPARFRSGFRVVHYTRRDKVPFFISFQFNDEQAYILEFTDKKLRFYKDEGIILESNKTITGVSNAIPGVVTSAAHGFNNGDEVFINDVVGMTELNGKSFLVANAGVNTFQLTDRDGVNVDTTLFGVYASGGIANRIYEIDTPYDELLDLKKLKVTQNADVMYIDHPYYEPRKLTRTGHTSWTLARYTRTADPFLDKKVITAITNASPGVVTSVGHGLVTGDVIIIEEVEGMTQLNSRPYLVNKINADTFSLVDYITNVAVNTTSYTAYSANGFASKQNLLPAALTFYEGRLAHGGMGENPSRFILSRSPDPTTGDARYDDYTAGTDADDAVYFSIADGEVNKILWFVGTNRLLMAGTFGTETKITGETSEKAIGPSSVNVRAENFLGVADVAPINKENIVIYVQRGSLAVRSFEFDALEERFVSVDRSLVAPHFTKGGIAQLTWQSGRPDMVWAVTNLGKLLGLTFKSREDISGWHQHETGKSFGDLFLTLATMPRPTLPDQLWVGTEREINGVTRRFAEFMEDEADIPEFVDYFTGDDNKEEDLAVFNLAMQEAQKGYMHLDCAVTYDGSQVGVDANATITPGAATGDNILFSSNNAVFSSTDVGREIWKKAIDGVGEGRATIISYVNSTSVRCNIEVDFDDASAMAPGDWYLTTDSVTNLDHAEGREVAVCADGGVHPSQVVVDGEIDLEYQASVIHVGYDYVGYVQPMVVEGGGTTGPSQAKKKILRRLGILFLNSLGTEFGTDLYHMEEIEFSRMPLTVGAPQPLFSGMKEVAYNDEWDINKTLIIRQAVPLPCTVLLLEPFLETDNE